MINRQFFFGVVVGSIVSLMFWGLFLMNYQANQVVECRGDLNIKKDDDTAIVPVSPPIHHDTPPVPPINTTEPLTYPITADDVIFMVFTGQGRAEREDWGYKTWLKRLPRSSLVFYSDFNCTKVPNCVNVGGAEQGRRMKNKVIEAFKHVFTHYSQKKWFVKLDDDSFIVIPRLLRALTHYDATDALYLGKYHDNYGDIYCEGGAGYIYSKGILNAMMPNNNYEDCMHEECPYEYEDLCTGRCIKRLFGSYCTHIPGMLQEARRDAKYYAMKNIYEEVVSIHEVRTFNMMDVLDLLFYEQAWQADAEP